MGPVSYYSDDRHERDPVQRQQGAAAIRYLSRQLPGQWTDNRYEQVNHYKDVIYVAVRKIVGLFGGATYQPARRRKPHRNRTTFGPGKTVAKAVSGPQAHGRDEDYEPLDDLDHPLARLVARPNPTETMGRLTGKAILQYLLTGVGPVWAVPSKADVEKPCQLWALRTPFMYPLLQVSRQYPYGAWRVQPSGPNWMGYLPSNFGGSNQFVIPGEEVKRFLNPHPIVDYDGWSPLTAGGVHLDVLQAVNESRKSFMDHGVQLDALIVLPGADEQALKGVTAAFSEQAGGSRNARKVVAVSSPPGTDGKNFVQTMNPSVRDMDFPNAWEQETKFCLALFGVPPAVAGLTASSSYAELYAAKEQFHEQQQDTVDELAAFYTQSLAWPFCSFPDEYLVQIKPRPVHDKEFAETKFKRQLDHDLLTYNEARAKDDMPAVEGGDVPVSLYVKAKEQEVAPQQPAPGAPGEPAPDQSGGGDPLAALLGSTPTGGAPPAPENEAGEDTLPPRESVEKARAVRNEGDKWQVGGRWYTKKNGKIRQTADPNKVKGPTKKEQAATAKQQKQQQSEASKAQVAATAEKLARGGEGLTHEEVASFDSHLKTRSAEELKTIARTLRQKVGGTKAQLADRLVAYAKQLKERSGLLTADDRKVLEQRRAGLDAKKNSAGPQAKQGGGANPAETPVAGPGGNRETPPTKQGGDAVKAQSGTHAAAAEELNAVIGGTLEPTELRAKLPPMTDAQFSAGLEKLHLAGKLRLNKDTDDEILRERGTGVEVAGQLFGTISRRSGVKVTPEDFRAAFGVPDSPAASPAPAPATGGTPHGKARAALEALGLPHAHLSDEQAGALHEGIKALHAATLPGGAAPAKKAARKPVGAK